MAPLDKSSDGPGFGHRTSIRQLKGVGPGRARLLAKLGIHTLGDALALLPRRYEDRRCLKKIDQLEVGVAGVIFGRVSSSGGRMRMKKKQRVFEVVVADETGRLIAAWFNCRAGYLKEKFRPGCRVYLYGTVWESGNRKVVFHPEAEVMDEEGSPPADFGGIVPVYPSTEGVSQRFLRSIMRKAVSAALPGLEEMVPGDIRQRLGLAGLKDSVEMVHMPPEGTDTAALNSWNTPWHRRLIFEELFLLQLGMALRRFQNRTISKPVRFKRREDHLVELRRRLPFSLTPAQERAYLEISSDMISPRPMRRLLQGDVGSGKTLVAAMACLLAAANECQSALMVPTELLAEQHYLTLRKFSGFFGLKTALLSSGRPAREKSAVLDGLRAGTIDLVVGTQALIQAAVHFRRLGLVVIDEQHRFGVSQRRSLLKKGDCPDALVMTATPIPRTMALAAYGDLDLSVIDALPPGRRPVKTVVLEEKGRSAVYSAVRAELESGRRAYIVYPLVEERAKSDLRAACRMAEHLRTTVFPQFSVGLIHGQMSFEERTEIMERFRSGAVSLLVATTVIELGMDVPEATIMVVEHSEHFGLSQLHQLRGRVGRGEHPARCFFMTGSRLTAEARKRLEVLSATNDGFQVAEEDLSLRGPGEFFGTRQAGLPELVVANLFRDRDLLLPARAEAMRLVEGDRDLAAPEHRLLRAKVAEHWEGKWDLATSG